MRSAMAWKDRATGSAVTFNSISYSMSSLNSETIYWFGEPIHHVNNSRILLHTMSPKNGAVILL